MQIEIGHIYMPAIVKAARVLEATEELIEEKAAWGQFASDIEKEKFLTEVQSRDAKSALTGAIRIASTKEYRHEHGHGDKVSFENALDKLNKQIEEAHKDVDFEYAAELINDIRSNMISDHSAFIDSHMRKKMERVVRVWRENTNATPSA